MSKVDLGKIGITLGGEWVNSVTYEILTEVSRKGISYISKRTTVNEDPELVSDAWQPASLRGESLYDLMVRTGRFEGTLDEFLQQYQDTLDAANTAAATANESNRVFTLAEETRVSNENGRVRAEEGRVSAEQDRATTFAGYNARIESIENSESTRQSNETTRQNNETARNNAEQVGPNSRQAKETARQDAEAIRVSHENARVAAEGTVESQTGRAYAEALRVTAESDRVSAENSRVIAEQGRQTAEGDRTTSVAGDGSRWGTFKQSEAQRANDFTASQNSRTTAYNTAEGNSSSTVGDGSRWGAYKTQEAARNTAYGTAEGSSSSVAGDGSRWGAYKTAEAARDEVSAADHQQAGEDHAQYIIDHESIANKANIDGNYPLMNVGSADNINGKDEVTESFFSRTTGGSADVSDGIAQLQGVGGNSVKVNQLLKNCGFNNTTNWSYMPTEATILASNNVLSFTCPSGVNINARIEQNFYTINGHYYYVKACIKSPKNVNVRFGLSSADSVVTSIIANTWTNIAVKLHNNSLTGTYQMQFYINDNAKLQENDVVQIKDIILIDLTAMGIDNLTTAAQVEEWLANNVGLQEYYDYNAGEVVNVNMVGLESIGHNLLNPATGKAQIIGAYDDVYGNYYGISGTSYGTLTFTNKLGVSTTITPDSDGKFLLEEEGELSVATPSADCCVFLWWDGSKTDYTTYERNVANLDITHIYGKKNGAGDRVRVFPTGACGLGDLKDMLYVEDGVTLAKRVMGEIDLGNINYDKSSDSEVYFYSPINPIARTSGDNDTAPTDFLNAKYSNDTYSHQLTSGYDKTITYSNANRIVIKDSAYNSSTAEAFKTAMNGVPLYYELATPETYTDLVYMGSELYEDGTPVTLPVPYEVNNWGIENVLPKNTSTILTAKPAVSCKYSIDAMETIDTLQDTIDMLNEEKADKVGKFPNMSVGSAESLVGDNPSSSEIIFRKTGSPDNVASGLAEFNQIKGKSLVWNQNVKNGNFAATANWNEYNCSYTVNNGIAAVVTNNSSSSLYQAPFSQAIINHKYYITGEVKADGTTTAAIRTEGSNSFDFVQTSTTSFVKGSSIFTALNNGRIQISIYNSGAGTTYARNIMLVDLTLMFGEGNEPSTVAEFEALYPLPYYAYNAGEIVNNAATGIEVVGFNQWDEEWEVGTIDSTTGANASSAQNIRSKNHIPVFPSTNYYMQGKVGAAVFFYDDTKNYISFGGGVPSDNIIATPAGAYFMRFAQGSAYGTTYNHDICINLSNASRNGTYEPYKKTIVPLNIPTLTGKKVVDGSTEGQESVTIFSDVVGEATVVGMKSAGTAYDFGQVDSDGYIRKVTKKVKVVDMGDLTFVYLNGRFGAALPNAKIYSSDTADGTLSEKYITKLGGADMTCFRYSGSGYFYNSSYTDASAFKTAMSGVLLVYELAEPEEYILDTPIVAGYQEDGDGTEARLPKDTSSSVQAAFAADIVYPMDAVGTLNKLPVNYDTTASLDALASALATTLSSALNGTLTITRGAFDATNQKYAWSVTFTPNE